MPKYKVVWIKWNGKENVCESCGKKPKTIYIATGHDHTDEIAPMCNCGAGIPFIKFYSEVKNPTHPLLYYSEYL